MFNLLTENLSYIDPGTGSYLYQVLMAAGVALGVYYKSVKIFFSSLINRVKRNKKT
jgi:hypothetical protein